MGRALRSTMSLPAIFSPVRTNGQVVADGGLLNNLPVDVVKAMGADIVIAVHLDTGKVQSEGGPLIARCGGAVHRGDDRRQ